VTLRGIRYRPGRSLIVVLLATVAVAAAVIAPAYSRAAQQSVLTDLLSDLPRAQAGLIASTKTGPDDAEATIKSTEAAVNAMLAHQPQLAGRLARPVGSANMPVAVQAPGDPVQAQMAYREGVCAHLTFTDGACPAIVGDVAISVRSAEKLGKQVGDTVLLKPAQGAVPRGTDPRKAPAQTYTITGVYQPVNTREDYWGNTYYFNFAPAAGDFPAQVDAVFVGTEDDMNNWLIAPPRIDVEYPLQVTEVGLDDTAGLRDGVNFVLERTSGSALQVNSGLNAVLSNYQTQESALARSIPLVALPLVLLCWFVLFLVVAALTEERSGEIALGKLRGLQLGQVTRFGVAEPLVLVALAAPIGFLLGLAVTETGAQLFLAARVHAEIRTPVIATAAGALIAGFAAALLAGRKTFSAGVLTLLRRVPERVTWQSNAIEASVAVLAVAAVYQIIATKDRTSPLAYAGPPLIALLAGLIAARVVAMWARLRIRSARHRGKLVTMLASAQIARRPAAARMITVVTVAVALLTFAVAIWDVAALNRQSVAESTVGADTVYSVTAESPAALVEGVRKADPTGDKAMAAALTSEHYGFTAGSVVQLVGVDSSRLAAVGVWPNRTSADVQKYARDLVGKAAPRIELSAGVVSVDVNVTQLEVAKPVRLGLLVADEDRAPRTIALGALEAGAHTYSSTADCADPCRLLSLVISRYPGDFTDSHVKLTVTAIKHRGQTLKTGLDEPGTWRIGRRTFDDQALTVQAIDKGLAITASGNSSADYVIDYGDTPDSQPVVLAGPTPDDDPTADTFRFPGLGTDPQPFQVADRVSALPRAGHWGLLFDLNTARLEAGRLSGLVDNDRLRYEVWANAKAGPDFPQKLEANGIHVIKVETMSGKLEQLGRFAPALALRLYLLAGAVAVLLALGAVLLSAYVGSAGRLYELSSLRVAGVPARALRRGIRREYGMLLGLPLIIGGLAGLGGAALLLPAIPLVTVGLDEPVPIYHLGQVWVPGAVAVVAVCFFVATLSVVRLVRRATPQRLREGVR
jgi:hypothetical protein